jgi:hypothetical protein
MATKQTGFRSLLFLGALFYLSAGLASPAPAQSTATDTINLEIEIPPAFSVEIYSEEGNVRLGPMLPNRFVAGTVQVQVLTNRGRPYRVVQTLEQDLAGGNGLTLDPGDISVSVSDGRNGGRSRIRSPRPLQAGQTVLFTSHRKGKEDQFVVSYSALGNHVIPAGDYWGRLSIEGEIE